LGEEIFEFDAFLNSKRFDLAEEIIWNIKSRSHLAFSHQNALMQRLARF